MSQALTLFSAEEARALTDEVKGDAQALWAKLLRLYEGKAHEALGYASWGTYYEAEFGGSKSAGYRLLEAARVVDAIPNVGNGASPPPTVHHAEALVPVLREDRGQVAEVWAEAVERNGTQPTAAQVREVVDEKRNGMAVHFSSATDEWATPQDFFDAVHAEFQFEVDVCALPTSAKCERYFAPEDDGLAQDWRGTCWMNPPYGDEIKHWVKKAHDSALDNDATVACLVPARVDTGWWWDYCRHAEIRFLRGRLRFGDSDTGAPFPSALVVFGRPARVVWWEWR